MHTNIYASAAVTVYISPTDPFGYHNYMQSLLTSFSCSFSHSQFIQCSHPFRNLVRQILLGFSLGSKHMFTRFTHFQPLRYNSLTLWAYLAQRHDQQHREKLTHSAIRTSSHKNGRLHHVNTVHVLCTHTRIHVAE